MGVRGAAALAALMGHNALEGGTPATTGNECECVQGTWRLSVSGPTPRTVSPASGGLTFIWKLPIWSSSSAISVSSHRICRKASTCGVLIESDRCTGRRAICREVGSVRQDHSVTLTCLPQQRAGERGRPTCAVDRPTPSSSSSNSGSAAGDSMLAGERAIPPFGSG